MKPELAWKLMPLLAAAVVGYFSGQVSAEQRLTRLETLVAERHAALIQRIDEVGQRTRQSHMEIRMDLDGIRKELMQILRELQ